MAREEYKHSNKSKVFMALSPKSERFLVPRVSRATLK